jgi:diguanylate cyclase (GGDEF)-like protein
VPVVSPPEVRHAQAAALEPIALPDAEHFAALVGRELAQCRRFGKGMGVLLIDAWPHSPQGDALAEEALLKLRQAVAARLRARVRGSDVVAMLGAQRFGLILMNAGRKEAEVVQLRLHKALGGPYGVDEQHHYIRLVMGAAAFPEMGASGTELVRGAEAALLRNTGLPLRA